MHKIPKCGHCLERAMRATGETDREIKKELQKQGLWEARWIWVTPDMPDSHYMGRVTPADASRLAIEFKSQMDAYT